MLLQQEHEQVAKWLEQERVKPLEAQQQARKEREEWERERSVRQQAEQRAKRLERAIQEFREDQRESPSSGWEGLSEDSQSAPDPLWENLFPTREAQEAGEGPRRLRVLRILLLSRRQRRSPLRTSRRTKSQNVGDGCRTPTTKGTGET